MRLSQSKLRGAILDTNDINCLQPKMSKNLLADDVLDGSFPAGVSVFSYSASILYRIFSQNRMEVTNEEHSI
jgi:hypothetical protein